jgi:serine/threonine protein kinase
MQEEHTTLVVGTTIRDPAGDSYVVEDLLGTGGFGAVYLVRDRHDKDNLFALKEVIDPNRQDHERFVFEGEILRRLYHRALPRVYQVFEHNKLKRVYMLMDYIEGKNLETLRKEQPEQRFPLSLVLAIMAPIVDASIYLHHQDPPIVHRDIKPANIIVPIKAEEAILVDFGLAKEYVEDNTTTVIRHGSPGYAALEQYGKGTAPRTDIYGLGATFYTLLTGTVPIDAITRATESKGVDPLAPASIVTPDVPTNVAKTLRRAMSLSIDDRFSSVEEFWQELTADIPHLQTTLPRIPSVYPPGALTRSKRQRVISTASQQHVPRWRKARILLSMVFALLFIGVIGTTFWSYIFVYGSHPSPSSTHHPTSTSITSAPVTPTTEISDFPIIAASYAGSAGDIMTGASTKMYLTNVRQNHGNIEGSFQGLGMVGTFKGTVTRSGILQFKVTIWQGNGTLSFEGTIKVGGDIVGSFKVLDQHGNFTGESGLYNLGIHL